jgi:hypothetical protein
MDGHTDLATRRIGSSINNGNEIIDHIFLLNTSRLTTAVIKKSGSFL